MSVTITSKTRNKVTGSQRKTVTDIALDNSYTTGGYTVTAADLGLRVVEDSIAKVRVAGAGAVTACQYDEANNKLIAYTASAEVANGIDVSAVTIRVLAFGY